MEESSENFYKPQIELPSWIERAELPAEEAAIRWGTLKVEGVLSLSGRIHVSTEMKWIKYRKGMEKITNNAKDKLIRNYLFYKTCDPFGCLECPSGTRARYRRSQPFVA